MEILASRKGRPRSEKKILVPRCRQQGNTLNDTVFNANCSAYSNCVKDCKPHRNIRTHTTLKIHRGADLTKQKFVPNIVYIL